MLLKELWGLSLIHIYIKGDESVEVTSQTVNLGDLVELECSDPKILPRLRTIHVLKFVDSSKKYSYHRRSRTVVSVLKLIQCCLLYTSRCV